MGNNIQARFLQNISQNRDEYLPYREAGILDLQECGRENRRCLELNLHLIGRNKISKTQGGISRNELFIKGIGK